MGLLLVTAVVALAEEQQSAPPWFLGDVPVAEIPSGDKWNFDAMPMVATLSKSAYTDAVTVECGQARETITFARRWSPTAFWAKRAWERQEKKRKH